MKKALSLILIAITSCGAVGAQTPQEPNKRNADEVLRITTELVQVDVVVTDKNDQVIPDLIARLSGTNRYWIAPERLTSRLASGAIAPLISSCSFVKDFAGSSALAT